MNPENCRTLIKDRNHLWWSIPIDREDNWNEIINKKFVRPDWAYPVQGKCNCGKNGCRNMSIYTIPDKLGLWSYNDTK